ncbi:MAG TPA: hypothetical protein VIS07_08895 [Candidatus Binatia bacterium]
MKLDGARGAAQRHRARLPGRPAAARHRSPRGRGRVGALHGERRRQRRERPQPRAGRFGHARRSDGLRRARHEANVLLGNLATGNQGGFEIDEKSRLERNAASGFEFTGFRVIGTRRCCGRTAPWAVVQRCTAKDALRDGFLVQGERNRVLQSRAEGCARGIRVSSSARATAVARSTALGDAERDLVDDAADCGGTRWRNDTFGTSNQGCIK